VRFLIGQSVRNPANSAEFSAHGRPAVARFERKIGARAESLDCMVYAMAAKAALSLNAAAFDQREDALRATTPPTPSPTTIQSKWMTERRPSWERYS
jgi:phage terminase large subunit GpA-like protein